MSNDGRETVGNNLCTHARDGIQDAGQSQALFTEVCGSEWQSNGEFECPYRGGFKCQGPPDRDTNTSTPPSTGNDYTTPVFEDNFSDSSLSSVWNTPGWPASYRPAIFTRDQCDEEGGRLRLTAERVGDEVHSCFAILDYLVGPGSGQTKIEVRANVSQLQAEGGWFAAWLQTLGDQGDPYDNNPSTGTEVDIMEYVPYNGPYQFAGGDQRDFRNQYHVATHVVDGTGGFSPGDNGFVDMNQQGVNLRSGDNVFAVEWNASCQVFTVNGRTIFTNRQGVSTAKVHRPVLSIEMSNASNPEHGRLYNQWGFASGQFADNLRSAPAVATVDYIKIYEKDTPDNLCG